MTSLPRILFVTHALGGGVEGHVSDLRALLAGQAVVDVMRPVSASVVQLQLFDDRLLTWRSDDWEKLLMGLQSHGYDRIHFHHVDGFASSILALAEGLRVPYDVTLHDYFPYCPQYQLSSSVEGDEYCGEPDAVACQGCVNAKPHAWGWSIARWRLSMGQFLGKAQRVIAPTNHVVLQVRNHFPALAISMHHHAPRAEWLATPQPLIKVVVIGALSKIKGLTKLLECAQLVKRENSLLTFILLGYPENPIDPELPVQVRGQYKDKDLPSLLALERPDVIWFPGLFPETHAYTLDVAIAGGYPIVAGARGAFQERLTNRPNCILIDANASATDCKTALTSVGISRLTLPTLQYSDARQVAQGQRDAYRDFILEPLRKASLQGSQPPRIDLSELEIIPPPFGNLPLTVLFEQGVLCGKSEPRKVLFQRLTDIERDYAVLARYSERANKPWFVLLEDTENIALDAAHLRRKANELQAEADRVRTSLHEQIVQLEQGLHAHADALSQKEQEVHSIRANLSEITHHLAQTDQLFLARGRDLLELETHLSKAVDQIRRLENSTSWRITAPWRAIGAFFKVANQRLSKLRHHLKFGYQKLPLAFQILRAQGPIGLARRVQLKLKGQRFHPPERPAVAIAEIHALDLPTHMGNTEPKVSLVIPVYGQHVHTFNCLKSLREHTDLSTVEIIVVDDASPEPVSSAMPAVKGIRLLRNEKNLGFIGSCNKGGSVSRGEYIVLLNNDIQVTEAWLDALLDVFRLRTDAGLVGARLVYPDGRLQEAGGIVWRDGSAWNWGRDGDPEHPDYRYLRAVDYCSGACLALRRTDWLRWNGFDTAYMPAYYEDTDLAFRVRSAGKQVYYQPEAKIIHFEGVSSGTDLTQGVKQHQVINQSTFYKRWQKTLQVHRVNGQNPHREVDRGAQKHILVVEACMITPDQDSGSVRMLAILELLIERGCKVSFVADNLELRQPYARMLQQQGVQIWHHPYIGSVSQLLEERGADFDVIMFCRHYIAMPYMKRVREWAPQATIVFDTVDLHYLREQRQAELENSASILAMSERTRIQELGVIRDADVTLVVSPVEQSLLANDAPGASVQILSNIHEPRSASTGYAQREGLLFIGGFRHPPNIDAVEWFVTEVWPLVRNQLPDLTLTIVGSHMPTSIQSLNDNGIRSLGFVEDVDPLLDRARISIAPLRYGAGVKGKINQAMACGLPVVATSVAAEGMGLIRGEELLVADLPQEMADAIVRLNGDESLWANLATGGYNNIRKHFSRSAARAALSSILA